MFGLGKGKGEIEIKLSSYNFSPGDLIEGVVTLSVKKPVKAEGVNITFVGQESTVARTYGPGHVGTSKTKRKIFEFKQPLDSAREYQPGQQDYPFKIKVPQNILTQSTPTTAGRVLMSLSGASSSVAWQLTANLDVPGGFDVSKTVQINIA